MTRPDQKALLIRVTGDEVHGLSALNEHLSDGWRIIETTPLGGGHATETVALVILEHQQQGEMPAIPVAERKSAPAEEEIVPPGVDPAEGDGATSDVDSGANPNVDMSASDPSDSAAGSPPDGVKNN